MGLRAESEERVIGHGKIGGLPMPAEADGIGGPLILGGRGPHGPGTASDGVGSPPLTPSLSMATIPVQPAKRGIPGWVWALLALLVLGFLAFLFLRDDDDVDTVSTAGDTTRVVTPAPAPATTPGVALTSFDSLGTPAGTTGTLAGRRVDVADAEVARVVSDSAFYVRSAGGRETLVVLNEREGVSTAGAASGFSVTEGDRVRVRGVVREAMAGLAGVPTAARSGLRDGALYVTASAADVVATAAPDMAEEPMAPPATEPPPPPAPESQTPPPAPVPDTTTTTN